MVLPLVLVLFLGIVDFGVAISDYNQLRQGVRESVRRAVVGDVGSDPGCTIGSPAPTDADTKLLVCLTKDKTGLDASKTQVAVGFESNGYLEGEPLILCAQYPLSSVSGLFGGLLNGTIVHTQIDMRIEKGTLVSLGAFQESGGDNWSWCG